MLPDFSKVKNNTTVYWLSLIPLILFGLYINHYALNVPYMDDSELISTIYDIKERTAEFFSIMVRQQNDHRTLFARLGIIISYLITGITDFRVTILLGYLNLILLVFAFYLIHKSERIDKFSFLPVPILLFSPAVYQVHLWSMTAFQYTLSVAFSLLCLYFLHPDKWKYWLLSILFAISASLTNLDGVSVLPVALLWLATQGRWKHFFAFLVFTVVYLLAFFTDFKFSSASKIDLTLHSIPQLLLSILTITGSLAKTMSDTHAVALSAFFGAIIFITFILLKIFPGLAEGRTKFSIRSLFDLDLIDICSLRLFASMVMIAIGRFADGLGTMVAIRFQIYSVSVAVLFYLFLLKSLRNKSRNYLQLIVLPLSVIVSCYSYIKYDSAINYLTEGLKADSYNYPHHKLFLHQFFNLADPEPWFYKHYQFPAYLPEKTVYAWTHHLQDLAEENVTKVSFREAPLGERNKSDIYPNIEILVQNHKADMPRTGIYFGLISNDLKRTCYILAAMKKRNGNYLSNLPKKIPTGSYSLIICWLENGKPLSRRLSSNILIKS